MVEVKTGLGHNKLIISKLEETIQNVVVNNFTIFKRLKAHLQGDTGSGRFKQSTDSKLTQAFSVDENRSG